jgi:hypothetical protein
VSQILVVGRLFRMATVMFFKVYIAYKMSDHCISLDNTKNFVDICC